MGKGWTVCCGHCKRPSIQKGQFCVVIGFTKNDESYISVVLSNDNDTSSHWAVALSIVHVINRNLTAWCPSILQSNANTRPCVPCVVFLPFPCFHFLTIFHRIPMDLGRDWWLQIIVRCHIRSENPSIIDSYDIYGHIWPKSIVLLLLRTPIHTLYVIIYEFPRLYATNSDVKGGESIKSDTYFSEMPVVITL